MLLRSGGEPLSTEHKLSEYVGVGTDTNPVFLIRRQDQQDLISTQEQEAVDALLKRKRFNSGAPRMYFGGFRASRTRVNKGVHF